jgi:hypothetical protein
VRSSEVVARVLEGLMHHTQRSAALARQRGGDADPSRAELAVLLLSGDAVGRRIAGRILARHCDRVDTAASWAEGLVRMRAEAYDMMLCERSVPPECYADAQRVTERAQLENGTLLIAIGGESASASPEARQALTEPLPLRWDGVLARLSDEAELARLVERVGEHQEAPDDASGRVANLVSPA